MTMEEIEKQLHTPEALALSEKLESIVRRHMHYSSHTGYFSINWPFEFMAMRDAYELGRSEEKPITMTDVTLILIQPQPVNKTTTQLAAESPAGVVEAREFGGKWYWVMWDEWLSTYHGKPDELDKKIEHCKDMEASGVVLEGRRSAIYPDLVADRDRLKARIAELEAWIKTTGRGMPPGNPGRHTLATEDSEQYRRDEGLVEPLGMDDFPNNSEGFNIQWSDSKRWHIVHPYEVVGKNSFAHPNEALAAINAARGCKPIELLTASTPVGSKVQAMDKVAFPDRLVYELEWQGSEDGAWHTTYLDRYNGKHDMTITADRFHQFRVVAGPEVGGK